MTAVLLAPLTAGAGDLRTLRSEELHFGSSLYLFRHQVDAPWVLREARDLGLTEIRVEYPRNRVDHGGRLREPNPEIFNLMRHAGFEVLLVLDGPLSGARGGPADWPRNDDHTIDGAAAGPGMARFARWVAEKTKDFVGTYELWNEAFGAFDGIGKQKFGKAYGFGPGGSRENADNYAAMFLPVAREIKAAAPGAHVTVEGNYWNLERSVKESPRFQELLRLADFAVIHPYGYKAAFYEHGDRGHDSIGDRIEYYRSVNPAIDFWWSEYGVHPRDMGISADGLSEATQAKALLRATLLHLSNGIRHLDPFCLYYPSTPWYSLETAGRQQRESWHALQRFLEAVAPGRAGFPGSLDRRSPLPAEFRDLAFARPGGFTYMIWRETDPRDFGRSTSPVRVTVSLRAAGALLHLSGATDPVSGRSPAEATARGVDDGAIEITLPVTDVPIICRLDAAPRPRARPIA